MIDTQAGKVSPHDETASTPGAVDPTSTEASGLIAPDTVSPEVRETAVLVGTLFRHLMSFSDGGDSLRMIDERGVSFVQFKAMIELSVYQSGDAPYLQELAESLGASMPSVSRAIDGLVREGLASRSEDPDDRRRRRIELTDTGREVINSFFSRRLAGAVRFSAGLDDDEREALDRAIALLLEREEIHPVFEQINKALPR